MNDARGVVKNMEPVPFGVARDPLGASALGVVDPTLLEEIAAAPLPSASVTGKSETRGCSNDQCNHH